MGAEPSPKTPAATVPAAAEQHTAAEVTDPVCWEFRLTADRRRILVLVSRATDPEFA
jgi:hypothetical protein